MGKVTRRCTLLGLAGVVLGALAILAAPGQARAQEDLEYLGTHRDWHAFTYMENGNRVCYIASRPTRDEGNYTRRGDIFMLVTHRPAENTRDVVSIITGYTFQPDSEAEVTVGTQQFRLFTSNDTAWAYDADDDRRIVQAMIQGSTMVVRGTSNRGTRTTDTYSLLGFTAAHNQIDELCR
ncbi:MAG: hypothetical protein H6842_04435 [Rhodospirillaceae bacterium]|nr:hypothetical protein [Rhodospirillaceae bacterium]